MLIWKSQINSKLKFPNDPNDSFQVLNLIHSCLPAPVPAEGGAGRGIYLVLGAWDLVLTSQRLAGFTRWNLFDKLFPSCRCEIFFYLPVLFGKGVPFLNQQPFLSCAPSLHQRKGKAAL